MNAPIWIEISVTNGKAHAEESRVLVTAICVDDIHEGSVRCVEANCFRRFLKSWPSRIHSCDSAKCLRELGLEVFPGVGTHVRAKRVSDTMEG